MVFLVTKDFLNPLTSLAKTSISPIPTTFALPPSWFVTVVSIAIVVLNRFLFTTMWSVLPVSTIESCSTASLEGLSDYRLEDKLPDLASGAFFMQVCSRWLFCLQKVHSSFSLLQHSDFM